MEFKTYDEQIAYLKENPDAIYSHWDRPTQFGPLFKKVTLEPRIINFKCGCLTQIRNDVDKFAYIQGEMNFDLTDEIRNDERIPKHGSYITIEDLPVFKEWQERIDKLQTA